MTADETNTAKTIVVDTVFGVARKQVFAGQDESATRVRVVAEPEVMARRPVIGETWHVVGRMANDANYGRQLVADAADLRRPSGRLIVRHLAGPRYRGIGMALAGRLWEAIGERLYDLLDRACDPSFQEKVVAELTAVPGLGRDKAITIIEGWKTTASEPGMYRFLDKHGFPVRLAHKILEYWADKGQSAILENPYRLLALADWREIDPKALDMGVAFDDPRRLVAAVEAACYSRLDSGRHTWTGRDELREIAGRFIGTAKLADQAIALAHADGAIVPVGGGWQPLAPNAMEGYVEQRVRALAAGTRQMSIGDVLADRPAVETMLSEYEAQHGIVLNAEQREAVWLAASQGVCLVLGGAGTGKTTVLKAIHFVLRRLARSVRQMALSGRAMKRMEEATGAKAMTIARFFKEIERGEIAVGRCETIVVDESSMLDLPTTYRILRLMDEASAVGADVRLCLLGDPGQLPPIGYGLTFHLLAEEPWVPKTTLVEVHRQAAASGIPAASQMIRAGRMPVLKEWIGRRAPGIYHAPATERDMGEVVATVMADLGGFDEARIVGSRRENVDGVTTLNSMFHARLSQPGQIFRFRVGEPVMWVVNDYERDLFNGTLGTVVGVELDGRFSAEFAGRTFELGPEDIDLIELAYAATAHKMQGSAFRRVVVPVLPNRNMDRTLLYTAVTRAQEQVVVVGDLKQIAEIIAAPPRPSIRDIGFGRTTSETVRADA
jgi:exodeoxyribonuclease V alpha subunit